MEACSLGILSLAADPSEIHVEEERARCRFDGQILTYHRSDVQTPAADNFWNL